MTFSLNLSTLTAVVVMLTVSVGCSWPPNYRELTLADGTVVLGSLDLLGRTELFSVRLENAPAAARLRSQASIHVRGRDLRLRDLTPDDLRAIGIDVEPYGDTGELHGGPCWGEQNRDGCLEFRFAGGRLRGFYARCFVTGACGFELSWPGRERFRLPMSQSQASAALQVVAVRDYSGH